MMSIISENSKEECIEISTEKQSFNNNRKYSINIKISKIKDQIKDVVISKYIDIIIKQNKEIENFKQKYNELNEKLSYILKFFLTHNSNSCKIIKNKINYSLFNDINKQKNTSQSKNQSKNKNINLKKVSNSKNKNKQNFLCLNQENKENINLNRSGININQDYLNKLNKKDMKKINSIHQKILHGQTFREKIINNSFLDTSNNNIIKKNSIQINTKKEKLIQPYSKKITNINSYISPKRVNSIHKKTGSTNELKNVSSYNCFLDISSVNSFNNNSSKEELNDCVRTYHSKFHTNKSSTFNFFKTKSNFGKNIKIREDYMCNPKIISFLKNQDQK